MQTKGEQQMMRQSLTMDLCEEEPQGSQLHPLMIDHIVENILGFMDPELLGYHCKLFRLVCRDWARIATKVYKTKRGRIHFKKNFIGRVSGLFIRVMKTSSDIPFEKFKFSTDSYDQEYFDELLHVCGGSMTHLELNIVNPCSLRFPKRYPSFVLGRLKSLVFFVRIECQKPLQVDMPSLLESILEAAPNLETLDIKVFGGIPRFPENILNYNSIVRRFGDIVSHKMPLKTKHLRLNMTLTDDQLQSLTAQPVRISSLDVYFQQSQFSKESMERFLAKFAPSVIKCKPLGNQFLMNIKFPVFPNLKYLVGSCRSSENAVQYSKLFPELHTLELCLWDDDRNTVSFGPNCFSKSVTRVKFPFIVTSIKVFPRMGMCFPNLRELLGITIGKGDTLKTLFQSLETLEVLDLSLGCEFNETYCVDAAFTGISTEACSAVLKYREFHQPLSGMNNWTKPDSIRNLKNLRRLSVCVPPLRVASKVKLTDVTVYYGFMQLPKLTRLRLDYFPITETALEKLKTKVHLTRPI